MVEMSETSNKAPNRKIGGAGSSKQTHREYGGSLRRVRCQANGLAYASTLGWMRVEPQQRNAHPTEDQRWKHESPDFQSRRESRTDYTLLSADVHSLRKYGRSSAECAGSEFSAEGSTERTLERDCVSQDCLYQLGFLLDFVRFLLRCFFFCRFRVA